MRLTDKKESMLVIFIFITAVLICIMISSHHANIITDYPDQPTVLSENDMQVSAPSGILTVGKSTRDQVMNIYPDGNNLGRSGIYRPNELDCLLTFSRNEDVLIRIDIGLCDLSTSRGIKVNDSFDKVIEKYGKGYIKAYDKDKPQIFDAYYGSDQYILFKVEDNIVKMIYIGSPVQ